MHKSEINLMRSAHALGLKTPTLCLDLDGTLIKDEILPLLGSQFGVGEELRSLTERTMNGQLPFEESFRYRIELLKHIPLLEARSLISKVVFRNQLLNTLQRWPFGKVVITSNLDVWVQELLEGKKLRFYSSTARLSDQSHVTGVINILNKAEVIMSLFEETIFIGDGANDLPALKAASVGILFAANRKPNSQMIDAADYICQSEEHICKMLEL